MSARFIPQLLCSDSFLFSVGVCSFVGSVLLFIVVPGLFAVIPVVLLDNYFGRSSCCLLTVGFNRLMTEFSSGCAHPGSGIDSVLLSVEAHALPKIVGSQNLCTYYAATREEGQMIPLLPRKTR